MSRPVSLPHAEHYQSMPCGSRAKYVAVQCRCPKCRAANSAYVKRRDRLARAAVVEIGPRPIAPIAQAWTAPDGTQRTRIYQRACQGVNGEPCPYRAHLRKDSSGDVCLRCRPRLAATWNGLVSADAVRAHLKTLSGQGVGYKSVAIAADVHNSTLSDILFAGKQQLRAQTARRILAIDRDARADHALVPAGPTWRRLRQLLAEGFTKTELARRLGSRSKTPALQFKRRFILAKSAARVERFYHVVMVA